MQKRISKRTLMVAALALTALLSALVLSKIAVSPKLHAGTIEALDAKRNTVMTITASATAIAAGISTIPGETTTPIANQITTISSYLLIVVCIIILEKYLISVFGYLTFGFLIPAACIFFGIYLFNNKKAFRNWAIKLSVFGIVIFMIIPVSVKVSSLIDNTYKASIENAITDAETLEDDEENEEGFWKKIGKGAADLFTKAQDMLWNFVDAVAVMLMTTCLIPVGVIFVMIWLIKFIFNISIDTSKITKKLISNKKEDLQTEKIAVEAGKLDL